jgi:hypothetical protein
VFLRWLFGLIYILRTRIWRRCLAIFATEQDEEDNRDSEDDHSATYASAGTDRSTNGHAAGRI